MSDNLENIKILNTASAKIKEGMKSIEVIYKDNEEISHYIWRINKSLVDLYRAITKQLDSKITYDEFKKIVGE